MRLHFETVTCPRCAGTGDYPSPAWQGKCLRCKHTGRILTPNGRRAYNAYRKAAEALSVPPAEITVGDQIMAALGASTTPRVWTVTDITTGTNRHTVNGIAHEQTRYDFSFAETGPRGTRHRAGFDSPVQRHAPERRAEIMRDIANRFTGATLIES